MGRTISSSGVTVRLTVVAASHKVVAAAGLGDEDGVGRLGLAAGAFPAFDDAGRKGAACADIRGAVAGNDRPWSTV